MATRHWRTLEKFDLNSLAKEELEVESGTAVSWELKPTSTQVDAYVNTGEDQTYICSMNNGGQIEEIHPAYAEYFGSTNKTSV